MRSALGAPLLQLDPASAGDTDPGASAVGGSDSRGSLAASRGLPGSVVEVTIELPAADHQGLGDDEPAAAGWQRAGQLLGIRWPAFPCIEAVVPGGPAAAHPALRPGLRLAAIRASGQEQLQLPGAGRAAAVEDGWTEGIDQPGPAQRAAVALLLQRLGDGQAVALRFAEEWAGDDLVSRLTFGGNFGGGFTVPAEAGPHGDEEEGEAGAVTDGVEPPPAPTGVRRVLRALPAAAGVAGLLIPG